MLFTRCILHKPEPEDGFRVSVMSRHTLDDGKTPDPRIKDFHLHIPSLGPHPTIIGPYLRKEMEWPVFAIHYRNELGMFPKLQQLKFLAKAALTQDITLLCIEQSHEHCHRKILARMCKEVEPALTVTHK